MSLRVDIEVTQTSGKESTVARNDEQIKIVAGALTVTHIIGLQTMFQNTKRAIDRDLHTIKFPPFQSHAY